MQIIFECYIYVTKYGSNVVKWPYFAFAASSTTEVVKCVVSSDNPVHWSVDDVIRRISEADPTLVPYAGHFRKHVSHQSLTFLIIS